MRTKVSLLSELHTRRIEATFPKARLLQADANPEAWMPFSLRVRLELAGGEEKTVDFREDLTPEKAALLRTLHRLGIPGPNLLSDPVASENGGFLTLCDVPQGENLLHWTLGGTPHRVRLASERAFESIDRLQAVTERLLSEPAGEKLTRLTLADEAAAIRNHGGEWLKDTWFTTALERVEKAVADIHDPLVFTDYTHFFPNFVRIYPTTAPTDTPLGWPGDVRLTENDIAEYVAPFGYIGDPLLGLAMVWIYDCYPFVHTGFVEQYLWRRNISRKEFDPRLGLKALQIIQRELSTVRPEEGASYWDALHGYVDEAMTSM